MNRDRVRQIANVIALVATLLMNWLANALPLNGMTQADIADQFEVLFMPAGYAFAIWGVIYAGLIAYVVYQALPSQRDNPRLRRIGWWFVGSCVANIAWLFVWHYALWGLSVLFMAAILVTLGVIARRRYRARAQASTLERWTVDVPLSLYVGWITVATVVNVTVALDVAGWGGWGLSPTLWTIVVLIVTEVLAAINSFTQADIAYQAALIWAVAAVAVMQEQNRVVAVAAWLAAGILVLIAIGGLWVRRGQRLRREGA